MSKSKAYNGLEYLDNQQYATEEMKLMASLLHRYIETEDKNYWAAASALAHPLNLSHILGYLPYRVKMVIEEVKSQVIEEAELYYHRMESKMGFIPFNVRQRVLLDRDDPALNAQKQAYGLAQTQGSSVERALIKFFRTGVWDGTMENVTKAYQRHHEIFYEGCYRREDYR
tara:strand:- start:366 stop:878 length:513 start_codon:yes stop_codon:yes gene_type:complete